ncbi:MAG: hypothetical protein A2527_10325 [Candidatus Lambdaproteobacteria bacterium RIFOXYD2_FULL_50_16]|uniref:Major facilitator superfamily (MFS) profile domain-containing protein n=1 Tax=Candidatus Lambdaproteobacteria bacterium RIFOXYD2_FULL_50_16 TaxID=1817772 RepID=A0A1F6GGG6_9PROT|nr:MAG: hypothetical protein A2527_10325 [Candidatus Lambdaproteobacteria bacterium RIFOXYD2_FULL_50_16]
MAPRPRLFGALLFYLNFWVILDHLVMIPLAMAISTDIGLKPEHTGYLISSYPVTAALSAFLSAPFSDRLGRKRLLLFALTGFAFASLGCALSSNPTQIFFFRLLSGVFGGPILPNSFAYVGDAFSGKERGHLIANLALSFSAASILGVPLGAWMSQALGWQSVFYAAALMTLLGVFGLFKGPSFAPEARGKLTRQYKELAGLWLRPEARAAFFVMFMMMIGLFGFVPNISVWLSHNYGYGVTDIAHCYMIGGIGAILGNRLAGRFLTKGWSIGLISGGSLMMALFLGLACFELFEKPPIEIFFGGIMLGGSMRIPAHQTILADLVPVALRGRLMSMNMIVGQMAMGLGGFWSSPLVRIEADHMYGMPKIGAVAIITLLCVPFLAARLKHFVLASTSGGPLPATPNHKV